jgi:hypothetical protein
MRVVFGAKMDKRQAWTFERKMTDQSTGWRRKEIVVGYNAILL